jgi:hypothetical protein
MLSEDISALVSYNGRIGVMWSNQSQDAMYFASHRDGDPDGTWTPNTALKQPEYADDHINLKSLQADDRGQVYAATKTSLNASDAPLTLLLVLDRTGTWQRHTFGRVADDHSRPMVLLDRANDSLFMFASSPCCGGGKVYYKKTSISRPSFQSGLGTLWMQAASGTKINNVASTKQEVNAETDIVAIAGAEGTKNYWHNEIDITQAGPDLTPPETTIDGGPSGTVRSTSATFSFSSNEAGSRFECRIDGGPFTACTVPTTYDGLAEGAHSFEVRAIDGAGNVDSTSAARTWTVDLTVPAEPTKTSIAPEADSYVSELSPSANFGSGLRLNVDDGSGNDEHTYLRFSVSGVSGSVQSAKVRAYAANGTGNGPKVFATTSSWLESSLTWLNRPLPIGAESDDKAAVATGSWVEFDVTPLVSGNGTYSFVLVPTSTDGMDLASKEDTVRRPTLELTTG